MEGSLAMEALQGPSEQSRPAGDASRECESRDETSQEMDCLVAASASAQVVVEPGHAPLSLGTAPTGPNNSPSTETDLPPSYDSLLVINQQPSQRRAMSGPPPSYASASRLERKTSCPAGDPGGEGETPPAQRIRKKPCVTLNIEEAIGASQETWCTLASGPGSSPAPSLQQQEGEVHDFRSSGGKSVFFYVQDETEEASTARGCDNLGFIADENDGSQMEGFIPLSDAKPNSLVPYPVRVPTLTKTPAPNPTNTVSSARRNSNPECLTVPREEMVRSQSFGTELGQAAAPPTLRKRSTSRGRPEPGPFDSPTESQTRETSLNPAVGDRTPRHVTQTESDETGSPSLLRKIFTSPFLGLSRSPSTKSCRSVREEYGKHRSCGQHSRPPQGPPSVREEHQRHQYVLQQHLYRNSRRNVQEKLHRQLSESDYHHHHHHHGHGRAQHHHHHHHHHRSQSQRNPTRPRHEPLRRTYTNGQEHYLRFRQELKERCQHEDALEASAGREEEEEEGEEEVTAVRRVSHYRQEEKGLTDVERWVGVHGGTGDDEAEHSTTTPNAAVAPTTPTSPTTPHIIVSTEDDDAADNTSPKVRLTYDNSEDQCESSASNEQVTNNGVTPTAINGPKMSLTMNSLGLPEARRPSIDINHYKRTRRNSMNEILRRMGGSQMNLNLPPHNMHRSGSRNSLVPSVVDWKQQGNDALIACVSALYGKLLVVMGMAFPVAEVISHDIPISFYNGFYLYLYIGSIAFLVYAYVFLLHAINIPTSQLKSKIQTLRRLHSKESHYTSSHDADKESDRASINTMSFKPPKYALTESNNHGSMYLKMGAVLFGIGSMIYSGLEVGQYFELQADDSCADILLVISPAARMVFTFIQMYFIFLNSRVAISRHRIIARFGLMHMIGTNLCIWLNVLVQETKHEIINLRFGHGGHHDHGVSGCNDSADHDGDSAVLGGHGHTIPHGHGDDHHMPDHVVHDDHVTITNGSHHHYNDSEATNSTHASEHSHNGHGQVFSIYECSRSELMGELVDNASPFLFPCTIEYSLLCAGVLYVIWNNINKPDVTCDGDSDITTYLSHKVRHHYSVDCAHANRGLFMGILILVLTIISLILFFVLINNEAYKSLAIMEANIIELTVYSVATVTVIVGMIQMRELEFVPEGDIELDNILLLIAQTGVYIYTSFTIIGGHFTMSDRSFMVLPLLSAIITLTQTTLQTIFILDATRRCCQNDDQLKRKPGREMVTFLLVCNLAMWAINTFETSRADAHPTQLNFYGIWAWTIISHISMPLAIFYRFHVTVCLCEIWKRSYKLKHEYY